MARQAHRILGTKVKLRAYQTRAVDAAVVADRLSTLSEIVETAGIDDISQGADLLAHSEDVAAMSAIVGLMSYSDIERGLELARMAGELRAISDVTHALEMPVLTAVLADRGERLQQVAGGLDRVVGQADRAGEDVGGSTR